MHFNLISQFTYPSTNACSPTLLFTGGADLAITYTSKDCTELATSLSEEFKVTVKAFKCEVSKSAEIDKMVEEVEKAFGKQVDIGIANAGE